MSSHNRLRSLKSTAVTVLTMSKKLAITLLLIFLFNIVSFSLEQTQDFEHYCNTEFVEFVEQVRQDWDLPGIAIAIVKDDKVVLAKGFGSTDLSGTEQVNANTVFSIASCSKSFTGLLLSLLQVEGKLDLNEPVTKYLPDFKLHNQYVTENITTLDFLTHRSGVPDHELSWYGSPKNRDELINSMQY